MTSDSEPIWDEWIDAYPRVDDPDHSVQRSPPAGIVVHSGETSDRVAESARDDGRDVSYHFAWSREHAGFVQMVSLRRRAWHAGAEGNSWVGIALPGPWTWDPRPEGQREGFRRLVQAVQLARGGAIRYWCRHSDITRGKRDPGPGVTEEWMVGLGLEWRRGPRGR